MIKDRVLLVWIPRTAGTSLWVSVQSSGLSFQRINEKRLGSFDPDRTITSFQHSSIARLLADGIIDAEWLAGCWVMAIVRNPWDRLVSVWSRLSQGTDEQRRAVAGVAASFSEFARFVVEGRAPAIDDETVPDVLAYAGRQTDWLNWPGGQPDHVGRFENLAPAWDAFHARLGLRTAGVRANASEHGHYREYYDAELRGAVARYYAEEIDQFHYTF